MRAANSVTIQSLLRQKLAKAGRLKLVIKLTGGAGGGGGGDSSLGGILERRIRLGGRGMGGG